MPASYQMKKSKAMQQILMRLFRTSVLTAVACACAAFFQGCSVDELEDNRDMDYGYVQFKLYKAASYNPATKAVTDELENLYDAGKIEVRMESAEGQEITQTLTLSAGDRDLAEYGMRSSKLRLLAGSYRIINFVLYDGVDKELYRGGTPANAGFSITPGGLIVHDLTADAKAKGFVRFHITKDLSAFDVPLTKAPERTYTFTEISSVTIQARATDGSFDAVTFEDLPVEHSEHFASEDVDGNPVESNKDFGYVTSSAICDTLLRAEGGPYEVMYLEAYDSNDKLLERCTYDADSRPVFTVSDNEEITAEVPVSLYEEDEYIQDYYALYAIWKALDGENWSYTGQSYAAGCNWNFNKDPDLWGDQPGVVLHANGRVANIDLAGFGIKGILPKEIGNLTELVQLHLGSHNEQKQYWETDPVQGTPVGASKEEKDRLRMERHRAYMKALHPAVQTSAPVALALREHNIAIDAISSYQDYTNDEISAFAASGTAPRKASDITTFDMNAGKMTNGLEGIDPAIGNLKKLEILFIANSPIKASGIPETIGDLSACTDLEIYNCTNLGELPKGIERMPSLIQVNLSNNNLGKGDDSDQNAAYKALQTLATGASRNQIQMIYFLNNNLRTIPDGIASMQKIGLLDFSNNNLHGTIKAFGPDFSPIEIYFDNNNIEAFENTPGFWRVDDMDVFSANYNKLTEFPNVFTADTDYSLSSISLAYNQISSFPADFRGLRTETLTLSANKMKSFPKELFGTDGVNTLASYVLMTANGMRKFPKDCFKSKYSTSLMSLDLSYNNLSELPEDFNAETFPYLYGVELSYNNFTYIPVGPLNSSSLTVLGMRGQRDDNGERCLKDWYQGIGDHTGLRGLYLGSNDLRVINDNISYLIFYLDISDNPNITFDASDICYYWQAGAYNLYYDKTQNILNCDAMLE